MKEFNNTFTRWDFDDKYIGMTVTIEDTITQIEYRDRVSNKESYGTPTSFGPSPPGTGINFKTTGTQTSSDSSEFDICFPEEDWTGKFKPGDKVRVSVYFKEVESTGSTVTYQIIFTTIEKI